MSTGLSFFKGKMSINMAATMDPYALNEQLSRINTYNIQAGGGLLRLTSGNLNLNYSFSSTQFEGDEEEEFEAYEYESISSGGRDDDLFGKVNDFTDRRLNQDDNKETATYPSYRTKIPWDLKLAYSLTYNNLSLIHI